MQDTPQAGSGDTTVELGRWPLVATLALAVVLLNLDRLGGDRLPILEAGFVAIVVVLLPILAVVQTQLIPGLVIERKSAYLNSMVTITLLGLSALALGYFRFGWEGMGLGPIPFVELVLWSVGLTAAGMALMFAFLGARLALGWAETPFLDLMIPKTPQERGLFVGVSLTAGFGEELVYRGYLLPLSWALLPGVWLPAIAGALLFGAVHAYQGWFGVIRTSLIALVLSLSMILIGTLWPAIIAHVLIDLLAGLAFARVLMASPKPTQATEPATE